MLKDADLSVFLGYLRNGPPLSAADPAEVLQSADGMWPEEVSTLTRAVRLAAEIGDATEEEAEVARHIARRVANIRSLHIENGDAWRQAISWARSQPPIPRHVAVRNDRIRQVALACLRLRARGYSLTVTSYGLEMSEKERARLFGNINGLISHMGGEEIIRQLCRIMKETDSIHGDMWMTGNKGLTINDEKAPALPIGWLFALAARHIGPRRKLNNPAKLWKTITSLAVDYAATLDCQRYSQFEQIDVAPAETWRAFRDSLLWREGFSHPQIPPQVLPSIKAALASLLTDDQRAAFGLSIEAIFRETAAILSQLAAERPTRFKGENLRRACPVLWMLGVGHMGEVNQQFSLPLQGQSDHNDFLFFAQGNDDYLAMPIAIFREAFCTILFKRIFRLVPKGAKLVGDIFEHAVYSACAEKTGDTWSALRYGVYEIDVASRLAQDITFFEVKAKALTAKARAGDMLGFYNDFAESVLRAAQQLIRHEKHLRAGDIAELSSEASPENRPFKVAVSSLSFGPVSDKTLLNAVMRAFVSARLVSLSDDATQTKMISEFNAKMEEIQSGAREFAPIDANDEPNLFAYFMDIVWLDLGELLYALDRSRTVRGALMPLRHMTFGSRDFWTEVAYAERQGLTQQHWPPLQ